MHERLNPGKIAGGRRRRRSAERTVAKAVDASTSRIERYGERLLGGDTKGTANAESRARREFVKEFAAVGVQSVSRSNDKVLDEVRRPGHADAGLENPLPPSQSRIAAGTEERLARAELLVVAGYNEPDIVDRVRPEIVGIVLRIEIREQTILFRKRPVPVPTETGRYSQIGSQFEIVLDEEAGLLGAKVTVRLAI